MAFWAGPISFTNNDFLCHEMLNKHSVLSLSKRRIEHGRVEALPTMPKAIIERFQETRSPILRAYVGVLVHALRCWPCTNSCVHLRWRIKNSKKMQKCGQNFWNRLSGTQKFWIEFPRFETCTNRNAVGDRGAGLAIARWIRSAHAYRIRSLIIYEC